MNIVQSVATVIENEFFLELGKDLFIGSAPADGEIPQAWLTWSGGTPLYRNHTGEMIKQHNITMAYRSSSPEDVYSLLQDVERFFNSAHCIQLSGFVTIQTSTVSFPTDDDIDLEGYTVGSLIIQIQVYE